MGQWKCQGNDTEWLRVLVHLRIQYQEGQGQGWQGYCCWRLYWRHYWNAWRIWNARRIRDAWRIRDARRRIRPFRMCLRPYAQRHGDWRLWDAPNATNGHWIWIWSHRISSHWWQWNSWRLHLWYCQEVDKDCWWSGGRGQRVAMAGWYGLVWQLLCLLWSNSHQQ